MQQISPAQKPGEGGGSASGEKMGKLGQQQSALNARALKGTHAAHEPADTPHRQRRGRSAPSRRRVSAAAAGIESIQRDVRSPSASCSAVSTRRGRTCSAPRRCCAGRSTSSSRSDRRRSSHDMLDAACSLRPPRLDKQRIGAPLAEDRRQGIVRPPLSDALLRKENDHRAWQRLSRPIADPAQVPLTLIRRWTEARQLSAK